MHRSHLAQPLRPEETCRPSGQAARMRAVEVTEQGCPSFRSVLSQCLPEGELPVADELGHGDEEFSFGLRQVWMPEVYQQDDAWFVAFVPRLVLESRVEDDTPAFTPTARFAANTNSTARRNAKSEMTSQQLVSGV